jgi:rRNA maturation RNase YbeY
MIILKRMAVFYHKQGVEFPAIKRREVGKWVKDVVESFGKKTGSISYIFCSDEKILEVNRNFLNHDYYTDVITFDYTENGVVSGDIFIGTDTVKSNAGQFNTDCHEELLRVMIHGVLHLCGVCDKSPEEREAMTKQENIALKRLEQYQII